ncbi:HNH endonuclease signature motif containing protein, partial [Nocardiopsis sp. JB363]|uniref:HNH endonuclease signature motif containing protein n=1 Tax=Nocardiopsis sp. JB363 TaxID=1434837 RepID=UPI000B35B51F
GFAGRDIPIGAEDEALEQCGRLNGEMDRIYYAMLPALARMEASGVVLEKGGQNTLKAWITHKWGTTPAEAGNLATLARALHHQQLPLVDEAFQGEVLSLGEACAIATSTEKATAEWAKVLETADEDFRAQHPDVEGFRARLEFGLIAYKKECPKASVRQLRDAAKWFVAQLDPDKADRDYDETFDNRGAQFSPTFEGGFLLRMWGPGADNQLIQAALDAYTEPYGPDNAAIPKHQRTYDAMMRIFETALAHRTCAKAPKPVVTLNITVPLKRYLGDASAEPAVTEDGVVIPDQMISRLTPKSWLRRFLTDAEGKTLLDVGQKHRCAPDPVRQAAGYKEFHCEWHEGCDMPRSWSQFDHIIAFSHGGATSSDNMQLLCSTHNRLKHRLQVKANQQIWDHHHTQNRQNTEKDGGGEGGEGEPAPATA